VLEGLPSSTPAVQRLNGFKDGVKLNPKIKVVPNKPPTGCRTSPDGVLAMLQANPDIKVVYASNDMMAAGSYLAAKGAGKEGRSASSAPTACRDRPGGCARSPRDNGPRRSPIRRGRPNRWIWPRKSC